MSFRNRIEQPVRAATRKAVGLTLAHTPITPNMLTLVGVMLTVVAVPLIASGAFLWAGITVIIASIFDTLDGALARAKHQTSRFGAFFDSTLDRYSDALMMLGFLIFYQRTSYASIELVLTFVAAAGSLLTSYVRARAESLGYSCKVGLAERPERIGLIVLGLLTGCVGPMLWLLAVVTNVTALQRLVYVWQRARDEVGTRASTYTLPGD